MDLEKMPTMVKVVFFLVMAAMAGIILLIGSPLIFQGSSQAVSDIPSYTGNTTAWVGFEAGLTAVPLLVGMLFFGLVAFGVWQLVKRMRDNYGGKGR